MCIRDRSKRHRVLAKVTRMPTSRKVEIAGQQVEVNNPDGEMTYFLSLIHIL